MSSETDAVSSPVAKRRERKPYSAGMLAFSWLIAGGLFYVFQSLVNRQPEPWQDRLIDAVGIANFCIGLTAGAQWWARHPDRSAFVNALYVFGAFFLAATGISLLSQTVFFQMDVPLRIDLHTALGLNLMQSVMAAGGAAFSQKHYPPRETEA